MITHGPHLKDFDDPMPCVYRGHLRDEAATLLRFAQSGYGYGYGWLAVIAVKGITISVPLRQVDFPHWMGA